MSVIFRFLLEVCRSNFALLVLEWTAMFTFLASQGKSILKVSARSAGGKLFLHAVCVIGVSQAATNLKLYVENCAGFDNLETAQNSFPDIVPLVQGFLFLKKMVS